MTLFSILLPFSYCSDIGDRYIGEWQGVYDNIPIYVTIDENTDNTYIVKIKKDGIKWSDARGYAYLNKSDIFPLKNSCLIRETNLYQVIICYNKQTKNLELTDEWLFSENIVLHKAN